MPKRTLDPKTFLYPMPVTLVGVMAEGRPNYLAVAFCGIVNHEPPMVAIGINKEHYSCHAIEEAMAFSVNLPTSKMMDAADYCGLVSGADEDKGALFSTFFGDYEEAPMIDECPLCLECSLLEALDYGGSDMVFIGQVLKAYAEENVLAGDRPEIEKLDPLLFAMHQDGYFRLGEKIGDAWSAGRDYAKKARG